MDKTCVIVGAGNFSSAEYHPPVGAFVIAADGGWTHLRGMCIIPDLLLGDFDSLDIVPEGIPILRVPKEKDDTDTLLAVKWGIERGYDRFLLYGGLGGPRFDHSLANIQTLAYIAEHGGRGFLIGENTVATIIKDRLAFSSTFTGPISMFSHGDRAAGVTLRGLKYPLENAALTNTMPLGVSNEFIGCDSAVTVESGMLTVVWEGREIPE